MGELSSLEFSSPEMPLSHLLNSQSKCPILPFFQTYCTPKSLTFRYLHISAFVLVSNETKIPGTKIHKVPLTVDQMQTYRIRSIATPFLNTNWVYFDLQENFTLKLICTLITKTCPFSKFYLESLQMWNKSNYLSSL